MLMVSVGVWWCYHRGRRLRREHSLPLAVNDFIETKKLQNERLLSSGTIIQSTNKAPPVPPRPTAYTTVLGHVEYRSNL